MTRIAAAGFRNTEIPRQPTARLKKGAGPDDDDAQPGDRTHSNGRMPVWWGPVRGAGKPSSDSRLSLFSVPKTSGHFWAATEVHRDQIDIFNKGTLRWYRSSDHAQRGFCNRCGASLFWRRVGREEFLSIGAGCIDAPTGLVTRAHIFVDDASDYYEVSPSEAQWAGSPQDFDSEPIAPSNGDEFR